MKKNTVKVIFVIRRNQINRNGKYSIVIRITVNDEYERLNSTLSIEQELWVSKASKAIGRTQKILNFNKRIEEIRYVDGISPKTRKTALSLTVFSSIINSHQQHYRVANRYYMKNI